MLLVVAAVVAGILTIANTNDLVLVQGTVLHAALKAMSTISTYAPSGIYIYLGINGFCSLLFALVLYKGKHLLVRVSKHWLANQMDIQNMAILCKLDKQILLIDGLGQVANKDGMFIQATSGTTDTIHVIAAQISCPLYKPLLTGTLVQEVFLGKLELLSVCQVITGILYLQMGNLPCML